MRSSSPGVPSAPSIPAARRPASIRAVRGPRRRSAPSSPRPPAPTRPAWRPRSRRSPACPGGGSPPSRGRSARASLPGARWSRPIGVMSESRARRCSSRRAVRRCRPRGRRGRPPPRRTTGTRASGESLEVGRRRRSRAAAGIEDRSEEIAEPLRARSSGRRCAGVRRRLQVRRGVEPGAIAGGARPSPRGTPRSSPCRCVPATRTAAGTCGGCGCAASAEPSRAVPTRGPGWMPKRLEHGTSDRAGRAAGRRGVGGSAPASPSSRRAARPGRGSRARAGTRCAGSPRAASGGSVCSMTRGPAKPMSALGSAMFTSPSMAKLAATPPVVGSVSTLM